MRRHLTTLQRLGLGAQPLPPFPNDAGEFSAPASPTGPRREHQRPVDVGAALAARICRDFDAASVAPMFGYASADAYYRDASAAHRLHEARVPLLCLCALDDPICAGACLPSAVPGGGGSSAILVLAPEGGHVGFAQARDPTGASWDNDIVVEFAAAILATHN